MKDYKPLKDILKKTNNVILFQETMMQVLHKVFGYDMIETNSIRKILSKKKKDQLKKLEPEFREKGKENKVPQDVIDYCWESMLASADYSFCLCVGGQNSVVKINDDFRIQKLLVSEVEVGDRLLSFDPKSGSQLYSKVIHIEEKEDVALYEYDFGGCFLTCSRRHKVFNPEQGMVPAAKAFEEGLSILTIHGYKKIVREKLVGDSLVYDFTIDNDSHNFYCNDVLVSNSHACSYGVLAAQMVYLKFKYPQSFFLHCLRNASKKPKPFDEIFQITQELPNFNIKLLPPNIVKSGLDFEKEGKDIRFGLSSIKSISSKSLESLSKFIKEEKTNKFAIFQAGKNAKINIAQMTALIYVGALDSISFDTERRLLALECAGWYFLTEREQAFLLQSGEKYDFSFGKAYKAIDDWKTTEGKKVARSTRKNTISKKLDTYRQIYTVNKENKRFAHWKFERSLLGYSYSSRLVNVFNCGSNISDVSSAVSQFEGDNVSFLGEVQKVDKWNSKNNNKCLKLLIADELKSINAMKVGKEEIALLEDQNLIPKVGDIVVLEGKRGDGDTIWIDKISIQDIHVVFKKSDLTKLLNKKDV